MKHSSMVPVTDFRIHALEAVRRVNQLGGSLVITAKGRPAAVLVSYDEWESMVETIAIKKDPRLMAQIRDSIRYFKAGGKGIPMDKIKWERP